EGVETVHGQVEDLARSRGAAVHHPQREGRQLGRRLGEAIPFGVIAFATGPELGKPFPGADLVQHLGGRWEPTRITMKGTEWTIAVSRQTRESIVSFQQRIVCE